MLCWWYPQRGFGFKVKYRGTALGLAESPESPECPEVSGHSAGVAGALYRGGGLRIPRQRWGCRRLFLWLKKGWVGCGYYHTQGGLLAFSLGL